MNNFSKKNELETLKIENQLYKELISQLPYSLVYQNPQLGYQVEKKKGKQFPVIHQFQKELVEEKQLNLTITTDLFEPVENILSKIIDHVPHHIVFTDKNGIITLCNLQAARDLHVDQNEMIGKHIRELLQIPDEKIIILETLRTGKEIIDQEVLDRNYGIINTRIIYDANGSIQRVVGTFQFLNRIKDAEKQALAGRIAAGIAHEVRNPLTTVRGYLQLLQMKVEPEISELFESLLIPEIDRANKIISDFLRIAKPSQTKTQIFQVTDFFNNQLGNFLNSEAHLYNGEINYELCPESETCLIEVNGDELIQVFINLFRNSLQAKQDEPLKIHIKTKLVKDLLVITFSDNGNGINPSILPYIFDPFFTTKNEGTGLGLSVSKKIIENHNGLMEVSSSKDGTVFSISLPIAKLS